MDGTDFEHSEIASPESVRDFAAALLPTSELQSMLRIVVVGRYQGGNWVPEHSYVCGPIPHHCRRLLNRTPPKF